MLRIILNVAILCIGVQSRDDGKSSGKNDEIHNLPGLTWNINFKQYAGYLSGSENGDDQHFYWFVESQRNPQNDPVLLWFNGGPGCSSLMGLLYENGPFLLDDGIVLKENKFAWNKIANVLYIESPAGVGFSYSSNGNWSDNDDRTANQNLHALRSFRRKFPQFQNNDLYLSGESYAGIYVPLLAREIVQSDQDIRNTLKGYLVGNGALSMPKSSRFMVDFAYGHRIISKEFFKLYRKACCEGNTGESRFGCVEVDYDNSPECQAMSKNFDKRRKGVNAYSINKDCHQSYPVNGPITHDSEGNELKINQSHSSSCVAKSIFLTENYFSRPDVRKALNLDDQSQKVNWMMCGYAGSKYDQTKYDDMSETLEFLVENGVRGLIFNGNLDMVCPFQQNEHVLNNLGIWKEEPIDHYYWMTASNQIGGYHMTYDPMLHYTTIKGAGHMAPREKPAESLAMLSVFFNNLTHTHKWV